MTIIGSRRAGTPRPVPSGARRISLAWLVLIAAAGAAAPAAAQGGDTTRHAAPDSATPAAPDTTAGVATGIGAAPTADSTRAASAAVAQDIASGPKTPADTALQRVRSLIAQGQMSAARSLVDSLLASTPQGSMAYASVLYTRATLATSADSAERDYRRVTVEYAASPRAADALLRLAQLELARGDREQAAAHLDRLTREQLPNQTGITFARTELQVGLAYFDLQDPTHACAALVSARAAAPPTDVELRNRIDYNVQRCPPPELAAAPSHDSSHAAGATTSDSLAKNGASRSGAPTSRSGAASKEPAPRSGKSAASAAASGAGRRVRAPGYTIQVAAYQTHEAAVKLVDQLGKRGLVARIYGASAPFRVRIGRFASETQADSAVRSLKGKGISGFVTPGEVPPI